MDYLCSKLQNFIIKIIRISTQFFFQYSMISKINKPKSSALLPPEIASRILDLQLDYEKKSINRESIVELMSLYSQAVEFYEENHDQKFVVFQNRLTNVLKNPYVVSILEGEAPNRIREKQIQQITKAAQNSAQFDATSLLHTFSDQKVRVQKKIDVQVSSQKSKILERVMNRSFNKSFNSSSKKIEDQKKHGSFIVQPKEKTKKQPRKNILDFLGKDAIQLPQRRKNIRAPLF